MATIRINYVNIEKQIAHITIQGKENSIGLISDGIMGFVKVGDKFKSQAGDVADAPEIIHENVQIRKSIAEDGSVFAWLRW